MLRFATCHLAACSSHSARQCQACPLLRGLCLVERPLHPNYSKSHSLHFFSSASVEHVEVALQSELTFMVFLIFPSLLGMASAVCRRCKPTVCHALREARYKAKEIRSLDFTRHSPRPSAACQGGLLKHSGYAIPESNSVLNGQRGLFRKQGQGKCLRLRLTRAKVEWADQRLSGVAHRLAGACDIV